MIYINQHGVCEIGRGATLESAIDNARENTGYRVQPQDSSEQRDKYSIYYTETRVADYNA
jgi:hypothetical protein